MDKANLKKCKGLSFSSLLFLLCAFFAISGEQKQNLPEEHEVEVRLVLVDVSVTMSGKFITDLTQEEFELFEDGKQVPINSCDLINFTPSKIMPQEKQDKTTIKSPKDIPMPKKQLVVVFDGINSLSRNLNKAAKKIVDEVLSVTQLGAEVMIVYLSEKKGLEILQPFTKKEKSIRNTLFQGSMGMWFDNSEDAWELALAEGIGLDDFRNMAKTIDVNFGTLKQWTQQENIWQEKAKFEKTLGGIFTIAHMVKDLPGRKSLLFISDGIPTLIPLNRKIDAGKIRIFDPFDILDAKEAMTGEEVIRKLVSFSNANNISIYTLDPGTFTKYFVTTDAEIRHTDLTSLYTGKASSKLERIRNLSWISENTGALALRGSKKYDVLVKTLNTDLNYYYQLSYYPPRKKPDDKHHDIKVKVHRSSMDVRHRKGYADYSDREEQKMRLVSSCYNPSFFKELSFEAEFVPFRKASKKVQPWMNIALPTRDLFLKRGLLQGPQKFDLHIWIKEEQGGEKAFAGKIPLHFDLDSSFIKRIESTEYLCYHYIGPEIPLRQGSYQIVFALQNQQTNEIGTWESSYTLPDFEEVEQATIMNCVLGVLAKSEEKAKDSFRLSAKDGGLESGRLKFYPSVTNRFGSKTSASVFMQILFPKNKIPAYPEFTVSNEKSGSQSIGFKRLKEFWEEKSRTWSAVFLLDLVPLSPGNYTLTVSLPSSGSTPAMSREIRLMRLH
ncbi:MAG: VWA domain-containing protein [Candidatus Aminicenantes bacterium]|nr:VWA domain-containing protein [Candidatus Aminicenantes bacterium]